MLVSVEELSSILRQDLVESIRFVNELVVSLDRIGSSTAQLTSAERAEVTDGYLDDWDVARRAAAVRRALSEYFDDELGPDHLDDLERELDGTIYWSLDGPRPTFDPERRWWREWRIR